MRGAGWPDVIEVRGARGVIRAISATQTIVEHEGGTVAFANTAFLDDTVKGT